MTIIFDIHSQSKNAEPIVIKMQELAKKINLFPQVGDIEYLNEAQIIAERDPNLPGYEYLNKPWHFNLYFPRPSYFDGDIDPNNGITILPLEMYRFAITVNEWCDPLYLGLARYPKRITIAEEVKLTQVSNWQWISCFDARPAFYQSPIHFHWSRISLADIKRPSPENLESCYQDYIDSHIYVVSLCQQLQLWQGQENNLKIEIQDNSNYLETGQLSGLFQIVSTWG